MNNKGKVLIAGGTGLIGNALIPLLEQSGYDVWILSRKKSGKEQIKMLYWDPYAGAVDPAITDFEYFINLAGAGIVDHAWTESYKKTILDSRMIPNSFLAGYLQGKNHKLKKVISVSAIGYYGNEKNKVFTEKSPVGQQGFLPEVCTIWEESTKGIKNLGVDTNILRIGIVLTPKGGFLKELSVTKAIRILNIIGSGKQNVSWIHIEDVCRLMDHLLSYNGASKIFNAVAPDPLPLSSFIKHLRNVWPGPYLILKVPAFVISILFGKRKEAILADQKVKSIYLEKTGFTFKYPDINKALSSLYT